MKKIIYGVVGVALGFLIYTFLLVKTPEFVNFTNISYTPEALTETEINYDEYSEKYKYSSPVYFNNYYLTSQDLSKYESEKTIEYGRLNPMEYFEYVKVEETPEIPNVDNGTIGTDDSIGSNEGIMNGINTKTGQMVSVNVDNIKQLISEAGVLPVDESLYNVTSGFGMRIDPFDKTKRFHKGLDIASEYIDGRKVVSVLDGIVVYKSTNSSYGNYIVVNHGEFDTLYAHLEGFARDVDVGTPVEAGDVIGYVGSTGRSTGPHLHLEFDVDWVRVDPEIFMNLLIDNPTNKSTHMIDFDYFKQKYGK